MTAMSGTVDGAQKTVTSEFDSGKVAIYPVDCHKTGAESR
jgi:hypothetical protein